MWKDDRYRTEKPIHRLMGQILDSVDRNRVTVVDSPTGSGKSALISGEIVYKNSAKTVMVAMPTVAAVISMQKYVRENISDPDIVGYACGGNVNYKFGKHKIIYATTQHVTNLFIQHKEKLPENFIFMLDEAHDTNSHTYVAMKLALNMELRMIVSSATPDLSALYGIDKNVLSAEGRIFPVKKIFAPRDADILNEQSVATSAFGILRSIPRAPRDNVLIFMPGESSIKKCADLILEGGLYSEENIYMISSSTEEDELHLLLDHALKGGIVVVSTNITESSITIPGVSRVIDCMSCKVLECKNGRNMLSLSPASQSNMIQRAGRAGRTCPGIYYAIGSEAQWMSAPRHSDQEFHLIDPIGYCLQFINNGLDIIAICDMPEKRHSAICATIDKLGLIEGGKITEIGKFVVKNQYDVMISTLLWHIKQQPRTKEMHMLVMALSLLEVSGNVYFIPKDMRKKPAFEINRYKREQFAEFIGGDDISTAFKIVKSMLSRPSDVTLQSWCKTNHFWSYVMYDVQRNYHIMCREVFGRILPVDESLGWYDVETHVIYLTIQKTFGEVYYTDKSVKIDMKKSFYNPYGPTCAMNSIVLQTPKGPITLLSSAFGYVAK